MNATANQQNWTAFLKLFSRQNSGRRTRIGVFDKPDSEQTDYWLEDGLPLIGIDVDAGSDGQPPTIEIILGDSVVADSRHLTHTIDSVRLAKIILSMDGTADGLEIEDLEGKTTILRFEG
jgi:hypothetical protein